MGLFLEHFSDLYKALVCAWIMFLLIPLDIGEAELQHGDIDQCRLLMERKMGKKKKDSRNVQITNLKCLSMHLCFCTCSPLIWCGFFTTSLTKCRTVSVCKVLSDFTISTMVWRDSLATGKTWRRIECEAATERLGYERPFIVSTRTVGLTLLLCLLLLFLLLHTTPSDAITWTPYWPVRGSRNSSIRCRKT